MNRLRSELRTTCALFLFTFLSFQADAATTHVVQVKDFFFSPANITISAGDTVTWVALGAGHTTTSADGFWDSGTLPLNSTFSFTFNNAGTFNYFCTPHRAIGMVGSVTVTGGAANQPPSVTLTAPSNGSTFQTSDSITFSANASDPDGSVTKVEFFSDGNLIGTATSSPFSAQASLSAGTHSITARATDNGGLTTTTSPITITVSGQNQPPTITLTAPSDGATFQTTDTITFSANASDDQAVTKVQFFSGRTLLGTATSAPYTVQASLPAGSHSVFASAFDNTGQVTATPPITITVVAPNPPPSVTLTAPAPNSTFQFTDTITFSADASDDVSVSKVQFFSDGNLIGTATSAPYTAQATLPPGTHSITARATDNSGLSTTTPAIEIAVNGQNSPPTITLTSPQSGAVVAAPANISLFATATDDGGITQVEFFQDGVSLGTVTTAPYQTAVQNVGAGVYNFTAVAHDNGGLATASTAVQIRVAAEPHIQTTTRNGDTITISASATDGIAYDLEATTDFVSWTTVNTATAANGVVTLTDSSAEPMRFYRVVAR